MAKQRQQKSIKKPKSMAKGKVKSQKVKKACSMRPHKHKRSEMSKRSTSTKSSKASSSSSSLAKKGSQPRKARTQQRKSPSKFNLYMKKTLSKIKQDHPGILHKDAFKQAAEQWANSPENPKNARH